MNVHGVAWWDFGQAENEQLRRGGVPGQKLRGSDNVVVQLYEGGGRMGAQEVS